MLPSGYPELETGQKWGQYIVLEKIDASDTHISYSAIDKALDRYVAIKLLRKPYSADPNDVTRFKQKAEHLSRLHHPHIAPFFHVGFEADTYYLVTEYIRGYTLQDWLNEGRVLDPHQAAWFMAQIVSALDHAASAGVLHLNVKPVRFVVNWDNVIQVANVGLVQCYNLIRGAENYDCLGSPSYASPEHISGRPTDIRTDIYCLGATLFHLMAGQPPFDAGTSDAICLSHLQEPFPADRAREYGLDERWLGVIRRMMEKSPKDRFQTYGELRTALSPAH